MMRRLLKQLFRDSATSSSPAAGPPQVLLYARVDRGLVPEGSTLGPQQSSADATRDTGMKGRHQDCQPGNGVANQTGRVNHRARILSMDLEHTRLCNPHRCVRLRHVGIVTAGDLAVCDPATVANRLGGGIKTLATLKRYRRAIRFSAAVPTMMPMDAMLLIHLHRRSLRGLAQESPAALCRDIQRFSLSTKGQRLLRGRPLPSVRRLKHWIAGCQATMRRVVNGATSGQVPVTRTNRAATPRFRAVA